MIKTQGNVCFKQSINDTEDVEYDSIIADVPENRVVARIDNGEAILEDIQDIRAGASIFGVVWALTVQSLGGVEMRSGTTTSLKRSNSSAYVIDSASELNGFSPSFVFGYTITKSKYFFYDVSSDMGHYPYWTIIDVNHKFAFSYIVSSVQNGASTVIPNHIQVAESQGFAAGDTVHWWAIKI